MGIVKGLKQLNKALDKPQSSGGDASKARWVKLEDGDRKSTRLNSSHVKRSRMPSSA